MILKACKNCHEAIQKTNGRWMHVVCRNGLVNEFHRCRRVVLTEERMTDLLRNGIRKQLDAPGKYIRIVQSRKWAVVGGGLDFAQLARFVLSDAVAEPEKET